MGGPSRPDICLSEWSEDELGSPIAEELFRAGFASEVTGVRLADGRDVVIKARSYLPRLAGAASVHRYLWAAGFPCPQPLAGPVGVGERWISAEALVSGGSPLIDDVEAPRQYASAFAELVRLAPSVAAVPNLLPPPDYVHWNHAERGTWPRRDLIDVNLNDGSDPQWLTDAAMRIRRRLAAFRGRFVVGHADWWSQNLRWVGSKLHVVFDWDSVTVQPEPMLVGTAAYLFASTTEEVDGCALGAGIDGMAEFLDAYLRAARRMWSADEYQVAWAAGLWVRLFHTRISRFETETNAFADLVRQDLSERLRRSGA